MDSMLSRRVNNTVLIRRMRAWLFNLCLVLADFFLSRACNLCEGKAVAASGETAVGAAKLPQKAGDLDSGWQSQSA
jgi:hypothetical protein